MFGPSKSLSLPNMGKMKSLSLGWKHRQTDCRCVDVTGILLLWHAAISVLHLPAWLPHSPWPCSGFCVYAWPSSLAAIFQCVTWSQYRGKRCFLILGNLRKVGVNFLSTACHILHSQRFCSGVWSHKKNHCAGMENCDFMAQIISTTYGMVNIFLEQFSV